VLQGYRRGKRETYALCCVIVYTPQDNNITTTPKARGPGGEVYIIEK